MVPIKERITVVGKTTAKSYVLHAVAITRTTDRDGVRYTEPGYVRSLCEQVMRVVLPEQDAEAVIVHATGGNRCRNCRAAMVASIEARAARIAIASDSEQFRQNAAELC